MSNENDFLNFDETENSSPELERIADEISQQQQQQKPTIESLVESMDDTQLTRLANAVGAQVHKRSPPAFGDMNDAEFRAWVDHAMRQAGRPNG